MISKSKWSLVKRKLQVDHTALNNDHAGDGVGSVISVLEPPKALLTAADLREMTESTSAAELFSMQRLRAIDDDKSLERQLGEVSPRGLELGL